MVVSASKLNFSMIALEIIGLRPLFPYGSSMNFSSIS